MPNRYLFSEDNGFGETGGSMGKGGNSGCHVSVVAGFVLTLLAVILAVGVGLVVHFVERDNYNRDIACTFPADSMADLLKQLRKGEDTTAMTTVATTTTSTPAVSGEEYRLPTDLKPRHYDLELTADIYGSDPAAFSLWGRVVITLDCETPTKVITLHAKNLSVPAAGVSVSQVGGANLAVAGVSLNSKLEFLHVELKEELQQGRSYQLDVEFSGPLTDDLAGLYLSSYKRNNQTVYLATTQFEVGDARAAFPCFDEPAMKATFNVTLLRKPPLVSLSNTPIIRTDTRADGWVADVYDKTPIMSTYLLAFIVCDFVHITKLTGKGIEFGVWARRELQDSMEYALHSGSTILDYYGDLFGTDFPLKKQDMVAIPDFAAGAMENWGLITYRESALLYKKGDSETQRQWVTLVIAHELAHQWFGNLVTMLWWDDLWLNEGFATYVEYIGMDKVAPEWKVWEQFSLTVVQLVFKSDQIFASHPLYTPVATVDLIWQYFDDISYSKGASVIRMLEFILGEATFRRGLQRYLKDYEYGNAANTGLWKAFAEQARSENKDLDVPSIMNTWTLQMGFPVVKVTRTFRGDVTFAQKRFLINPDAKDPGVFKSPYGYQWDIPLTLTSSQQPNFNVTQDDVRWLYRTDASKTITPWTTMATPDDKDGWMLANINQYGFYRVNYDPENWRALVKQLNTDHKVIPPINRAQIIDDAWNLANAGETTIEIAMSTLEYLGNEEDYVPWGAAKTFLDDLKDKLHGTSGYGALRRFIQDRIRPIFSKLGLDDTGATSLQSFARTEVVGLACASGLPECVQGAVKLFKQWKENPDNNPFSPSLRKQLYCTALSEGDEDDWHFVLTMYRKETSPAERPVLMRSLACTSKIWLLSTLLDMSLETKDIRRDDATRMIGYVGSNSVGSRLAWDFVREHWDLLQRDFAQSSSSMSFMIDSIVTDFRSDFQLQMFTDFVKEKSPEGAKKVYLEQAFEKVEFNVKWNKNFFQQIVQWLAAAGFNEFEGTGTEVKVTPENVRLPTNLKPVHYDVTIEPNMYGPNATEFTFNGTMTFTFMCLNSTDKIVLHINELEVDSINVAPASAGQTSSPQYVSHSEDKGLQFLIISLSGPLTAGLNYSVSMDFKGPLDNKGLDGLYLSSYKNATDTVYLAVTQFEPTDARKAFPCMDEPSLKATFTITLVRRTFNKALSNMPLETSTNLPGGRVADKFQKSVPMSTYLVALIVCDFQGNTKLTRRNVTFEVWSRSEYAQQLDFALDFGVKAMDFLEDYFAVPFPLPKQAMIAIPDFTAGAMENWGLITYRETRVLYEPGVSSMGDKEAAAMTIAHELAHMWFGDLVTMVWWDELWLNEGFARFMQYLGVDHIYPEWKEFELFVRVVHAAMAKDGLVSSHPVYVPVATPAQINEIFDSISYDKGASIIRMIRHAIGEDTFKQALTNYLTQLKYQNAARTHLWNALNDQARVAGSTINVGEVMDTWTVQMNYPVVTVTKQGQSLTISQERFLQDPTAEDPGKYKSPFGYMWDIPFTYTTGTNPNFDAPKDGIKWLMRNEYNKTFADNSLQASTWILGNVRELGYYRVNYDQDNWNKLTTQLKTNHLVIHPVNRAQLINDAWNLASGGYLSLATALSTVEYLDKEADFIPWNAAIAELGYVNNMLASKGIYGAYQMFMRNKTRQLYRQLGMNNTNAGLRDSFLRTLIADAACGAGEAGCVQDALSLFAQWKQNPANNPISPELRSVVYCTAVENGGIEEWQFLYERFKVEANINEKNRMMYQLSCAKDPWVLSRLMNLALYSDEIRSQDTVHVLGRVMLNPAGSSPGWSFIRSSWDDIFERYRKDPFALKNLFSPFGKVFNTQIQLDEMKNFMDDHPDLGSGTRAFQSAMESTKNNVRWMDKNYDIIKNWLDGNGFKV